MPSRVTGAIGEGEALRRYRSLTRVIATLAEAVTISLRRRPHTQTTGTK